MEVKQIEVTCPCCETRLEVDVRSAKVMRHSPPQQLDETGKPILDESRWDVAKERIAGRHEVGTDIFDDALRKEQSRGRDLDDLFDRAKRKLEDRGNDDDGDGGEDG